MSQKWYILIDKDLRGPFNLWQLVRELRMTSDPLVRKGLTGDWRKASAYKRLRPFIKRRIKEIKPQEESTLKETPSEVLAAEGEFSPPPNGTWVELIFIALLVALAGIYALAQ